MQKLKKNKKEKNYNLISNYSYILKNHNFNLKKKKINYIKIYFQLKKKIKLLQFNSFENKKLKKYKPKEIDIFVSQIYKIYKNPFFSFKQEFLFKKKLDKNFLNYFYSIYNKKNNSNIMRGRIINYFYNNKKKKEKIYVYFFGKILILKVKRLLLKLKKKKKIKNRYQFRRYIKNYLLKDFLFKKYTMNSIKKKYKNKIIISRKTYVKQLEKFIYKIISRLRYLKIKKLKKKNYLFLQKKNKC